MTTFTTEDRIQAEKIEDVILDAQDAFHVFDDEQGNIFTDDDRMLFCEGFNQGMEAMRKATLTLLGEMKDGV
jgi:hypothetical protein